jgi:hypothetical protein
MLGISLVANGVLLASLLLVLLFARAGAFSASGSSLQSGPPGTAPTATPTGPRTTSTNTPLSGWLQVEPTSVQLDCAGDQQTQVAQLTNTGPDDVQWQVDYSIPPDQAGVQVNPQQGDLHAGTSVSLQIQLHHHPGSQQGVIRFDPMTPAAGTPPTLSYTITGCGG